MLTGKITYIQLSTLPAMTFPNFCTSLRSTLRKLILRWNHCCIEAISKLCILYPEHEDSVKQSAFDNDLVLPGRKMVGEPENFDYWLAEVTPLKMCRRLNKVPGKNDGFRQLSFLNHCSEMPVPHEFYLSVPAISSDWLECNVTIQTISCLVFELI